MNTDPTTTASRTLKAPTATPAGERPAYAHDNASSATLINDTHEGIHQKVGGFQFWSIFISLMVCTFLSALDLTSVSTALPTIIGDLHGQDFVWVGTAFTLGSTAWLPLSGGLAQVFGRRPVILSSVALFALGSGICGGASTMSMLIAGRAIQGIGGGGILTSTEIIIADLVPLRQRGPYVGIVGGVWAVASAIGPPVGGAFSALNWRWLFYINLPLSGIAFGLVFFFFHTKRPEGDFKTKIKRMDWIGNILIIFAATMICVGLSWGGIIYSWSSARVVSFLVIGFVALASFFIYEAKVAEEPVVPPRLFNNRTSTLGYITTFVHGLITTMVIYYLPVYFQGSLLQSPIRSGVSIFGYAFTIAPGAAICGVTMALSHKYRPQNFFGWACLLVGMGLLPLLKADSTRAQYVGYQILGGIGLGFIFTAPKFAILAPLPIKENAHALALFSFSRQFSQTFGISIGASLLQNELKNRLPAEFVSKFPQGIEIAFAAIPHIPSLPTDLQRLVQVAFADSTRIIWYVAIGLAAFGFLCVFGMREIKLHTVTDEDWGIDETKRPRSTIVEQV